MSKFKRIFLLWFVVHVPFILALTPIPAETTLPLKFDTGNPAPYGMPSTIISIQGKTIPLLFDTGAKNVQLALSKRALENIQVKYTGKTVCTHAMDGKHCQKEFIIPEVRIGAFTLKNVQGRLMDKLWGGNDAGFNGNAASDNGIIGFALLSQFNLLLDYPHAKAILTKPHTQPTDYAMQSWTSIPFAGHLLTRLTFDGKPITVSWDTGAVPSIISSKFTQTWSHRPCPTQAPYAKKGCLSVATTNLTTAADNKKLPATWFMLSDVPAYAPFNGLVGSNFYAQNLVYFDFDQQQIYVQHPENLTNQ